MRGRQCRIGNIGKNGALKFSQRLSGISKLGLRNRTRAGSYSLRVAEADAFLLWLTLTDTAKAARSFPRGLWRGNLEQRRVV